ncbi:MAG: Cyclohexadienyl dehydrogenase [Elusimicrobia bacterium]|nr:Cyclohexadienyl dehydrogenase [Elusimicrobiota bacterium]
MLRVGIVGVGLIGGSLGLSLRKSKNAGRRRYWVGGWGRNKSHLTLAKKLGAIDAPLQKPSDFRKMDIVILCIPVHKIIPFIEKNLHFFKPGAIISDVGSVKGNIVRGMKKCLERRSDIHFVGAHPIAGSEKTGVAHAETDLFNKATCVLTKDQASFKALDTLRQLWKTTGARCVLMSADQHDHCLALTSHLPHLLSFALFNQVAKESTKNPLIRVLVGGSFRDMTRVAGADSELWTGIVGSNRKEIQKSINQFLKNIQFFSHATPRALMDSLTDLAREKKKWS